MNKKSGNCFKNKINALKNIKWLKELKKKFRNENCQKNGIRLSRGQNPGRQDYKANTQALGQNSSMKVCKTENKTEHEQMKMAEVGVLENALG